RVFSEESLQGRGTGSGRWLRQGGIDYPSLPNVDYRVHAQCPLDRRVTYSCANSCRQRHGSSLKSEISNLRSVRLCVPSMCFTPSNATHGRLCLFRGFQLLLFSGGLTDPCPRVPEGQSLETAPSLDVMP